MSNYGFSYPFDGYVVPTDDDEMAEFEEYVDVPYTPAEMMQRYLIQFDDDKDYTFHDTIPV